ncbi:uncharacterized protein [Rutidosis leptorrhynchoides]|uniref:uncharacterized protein n=1 Tax=Rutidosis leptorrhynchoides TaxID=125765 RepID=UPI003A997432
MSNNEKDGWEYLLDIDDSNLPQSVSVSKPTQTILVPTKSPQPNRQKQKQPISPQRPVLRGYGSNKKNKLSYQILGPAGIFQDAYELRNNENNVVDYMSTQDFVREIINRPEVDDSFTLDQWLRAMEFAYPYGGRSDIASILRQRRFLPADQVVGVVKTCEKNEFGDLSVTLKDTTGTIRGSVSGKIINGVHGKYEGVKGIREGAVLVLQNCSIFCPSVEVKIFNITRKVLIKVFFLKKVDLPRELSYCCCLN